MAKGTKRAKTAGKKTAVLAASQEETIASASEGNAEEIAKEELTVKPESATVLPESPAELQTANSAENAKKAEPKKKRGSKKNASAKAEKPKRGSRKTAAVNDETSETKADDEAVIEEPQTGAKEPEQKKRGGRKPMTAQEKAEAAKKREEEKAKADNMVPVLVLQYQGAEVDTAALVEAAKREFKSQHKRTLITSLQMYLKPEENTAYYVINDSITGAIKY